MRGNTVKLLVAGSVIAAALASVAPGISAPKRGDRADEYPLSVIVTQTDPKRPKAGKPFTAFIGVINQDTGEPVQSGNVACPARIGARGVRKTDKGFVDGTGIAVCEWAIPRKAGGKHLVATVELYSDEGTVRSRFKRVVRP
jgi:hypothetical protein